MGIVYLTGSTDQYVWFGSENQNNVGMRTNTFIILLFLTCSSFDMRKNFFTVRMTKYWNRLPREDMECCVPH